VVGGAVCRGAQVGGAAAGALAVKGQCEETLSYFCLPMPIFNVDVPMLTYTMPLRLEVSDTGALVSSHSYFDDLPEAAQRLTLGEDFGEVKRHLKLTGELMPFAVPLWCFIGFAPPFFAELTKWAKGRHFAVPNYIDSPHPEHLLRDYSFEYLYLALAASNAMDFSGPKEASLDSLFNSDFNKFDVVCKVHPVFSELNKLLIPLILDADKRIGACNLLLSYPDREKEDFVLRQYIELKTLTEIRRDVEKTYASNTPEELDNDLQPADWTHVSEKTVKRTCELLRSEENKELLNGIVDSLNIWPEEDALVELPRTAAGLWKKLEDEPFVFKSGIIEKLLELGEPVGPIIDYCEGTDEWLSELANNFGKFQQRIGEDDRIPSPREYVLKLLAEYESGEHIVKGIHFAIGDFLQNYTAQVDFESLVNNYLISGEPRLIERGSLLIYQLWEYQEPIKSRNETGNIETVFPNLRYPERLFGIRGDSLGELLRAVTDPTIDIEFEQGIAEPYQAVKLIAYFQPVHRSFIIDYLLTNFHYTDEIRTNRLATVLVELHSLGYRTNDIVDKVKELTADLESISTFLTVAIASTFDAELIALLKLWDRAQNLIGIDYLLTTAIEYRLKAFVDEYHRLPGINPCLTRNT